MTQLAKALGNTQLERTRNLLTMSDQDRKLLAAKAVAERDADALWEITAAFMDSKQRSPNTMRLYHRGVLDLLAAWQHVDLLRPPGSAAQLYVRELSGDEENGVPGVSAGTVRARVAAARALYKALRWTGVTRANPFLEVELPKLSTTPREHATRKAYSPDELDVLLAGIEGGDGDDWQEIEAAQRLIVYLGAHGGLRASEMLRLRWRDVDERRKLLWVLRGKGGKDASVPLSSSLGRFLADRRFELKAKGRLPEFVLPWRSSSSLYRQLEGMWLRGWRSRLQEWEEIPEFKGVHGLRHSAGKRLTDETKDLRKTRDFLRHASTKTTEIYAGSSTPSEVESW